MKPKPLFEDGEYKLTLLFASNQAFERTVTATLIPDNACGISYSELTYPDEAFEQTAILPEFEFIVENQLDF